MKAAYETKIKELTEEQKRHLAWRLEHKGYCGNITAVRIARGEYRFSNGMIASEMTLLQVFTEFDFTDHSAKIHSRKVIDFKSKKKRFDMRDEIDDPYDYDMDDYNWWDDKEWNKE